MMTLRAVRWVAKQRAASRCIQCGKVPVQRFTRCRSCRQYQTDLMKRLRASRAA